MPAKYKNPGRIGFDGEIHRAAGGGAFIEFPFNVEQLFGVKGRVPVNVTFDGLPYRGSMVKMGSQRHLLLILKEIREQLGKDRGDPVRVTVELDEAPRVVALAPDIETVFKEAGVLKLYRAQSFSHQREQALWIEDAKRAETRRRRMEKAVDALRAKGAPPQITRA